MIIRGATLSSRLAVIFAFLFTLTACGGGGGGGGGFIGGDGDAAKLVLALFDPQGNSTDTVTSSSPGTLRVTVKGGGANVVVNATSSIGNIFPASKTALTDSKGVATFQIEAGLEKGAGTISASAATKNNGTATGSLNFQVGDSGLRMGYFDNDGTFLENQISISPKGTLSAGGNAQVSVVILNSDDERVTNAEEVRFNSGCIAAGQATINPVNPVKSANGQASTLYTAKGCAGTDKITASLVGASAQAFGELNIASPQANAVTFVSAEPNLIVLRGTGGQNRDETSDVTFKVVDSTGAAISGVAVNFSLSTSVGGLSLSKMSALSDGEGQAVVTVSAGDVATSVRVIATVTDGNGQTVSTVSDLIVVTTGLPDQNSISLSVGGTFVVTDGFNTDGIERTLTVRMADKFNNPVVDGTAAVFTTEYGAIDPSCQTGVANGERQGGVPPTGECSVKWTSSEPRFPTLSGTTFIRTIESDPGYDCDSHNGNSGPCPDDLGYTRGGRSEILVHAIGEESFIDRNGNGVMDEDERDLFDNLPEAFLDQNEDGVYTPSLPACLANPTGSPQCIAGIEEIFVDFNANSQYDLNNDPAVYNGLLCPPEGDGVWCSRDLVNVRDSHRIILSANPAWDIILVRASNGSVVSGTTEGVDYIAYLSDLFNNPPAGGTSVTVSAAGGCELLSPASFEVPNTASTGAFSIPIRTDGNGEDGSITISFSGYSEVFSCTSSAPIEDCDLSPQPPGCPVI